MPDKDEIEIKFPVADPEQARAALMDMGAQPISRRSENNLRMDGTDRRLRDNGVMLRVRQTDTDGALAHILTIKMDTESDTSHGMRVRREIEFKIDDQLETILTVLEILGYVPYWRYEKRREIYRLDALEIVLDEMPYGWFLEMEGEAADIEACMQKMHLTREQGIMLSYSEIFENVRAALGMERIDLTFESFAGIQVDPRWYTGAPE